MPTTVPNTQTGTLTDHQHGSDDTLLGVDDATNVLFGDAFAMDDHSFGGNDTLTGGSSFSADTSNTLYGDAFDMTDHGLGGNDTLFGGANLSTASTVSNVLVRRRLPHGRPRHRRRRHADRGRQCEQRRVRHFDDGQ